MAFGDLVTNGTGSSSGASILASNAISINGGTGVAVSSGYLVIAVLAEQTALTSSGCSDNLGNTYTAQNAGTGTTVSGRMWYTIVSVPGTLTTVTMTATASGDDFACCAAIFVGPFMRPIDANPANGTADITTPFNCPSTGTLKMAVELVVAWAAHNANAAWTATAPNLLAINVNRLNAAALIGRQVTSSTSTVTPVFAGTNPANTNLGTASFLQQPYGGVFSDISRENIGIYTKSIVAVPYR